MSSTYVDLREARAELAHSLQQVFGAELIVMETFGSDAAPPNVTSVARVRDCDFFVGIYAHRYGTIDPASGKSITELELDEARLAHSQGVIRDILLYVIDPTSNWLLECRESDPSAQVALRNLKEQVSRHTYTRFRASYELFVAVVRDIYRRVGPSLQAEPTVRFVEVPRTVRLDRPMGMSFLTSPERQWLIGREDTIQRLHNLLRDESILLLLGNSGVGKTSLIHAGLQPYAAGQGWRVISTRPVGFPRTEVIRQLESSVYERPLPYHGTLDAALAQIANRIQQPLLLILDQFEDVLASRDMTQVGALIADLRRVREMAHPGVHVLISYRADMEARLGQFWQIVSGAAHGLPRVYLDGIDHDAAWDGFVRMTTDLGVELHLGRDDVGVIKADTVAAGAAAGCVGVYPPHLQMFVEHVWDASGQGSRGYSEVDYRGQGGINGVIGKFLSRQLEGVLDPEGRVRSVLIALVKGYGARAQSTIDDISEQTSFSKTECEAIVERLIDVRLVRHVENYYEVTHDLVAQHIVVEVLDPIEREYKRYRELLGAKAASYDATGNVLTVEEMLMLFKHRERVRPNLSELTLMLASWADEDVPGLHWFRVATTNVISDWLAAESGRRRRLLHREWDPHIVVLKSLLTTDPLTSSDYLHLRDFQLAKEMAALILEKRAVVPADVILRGLRHWREEVRAACVSAIVTQMNAGNLGWLDVLKARSGRAVKSAYQALVLSPGLNPLPAGGANPRYLHEFDLLRRIATGRDRQSILLSYRGLQRLRSSGWIGVFATGLTYVGTGRITILLRRAKRSSAEGAEVLLGSVGPQASRADVHELLRTYRDWNAEERAWDRKAMALGWATRRAVVSADVSVLRRAVASIRLTRSAREVIAALLGLAEVSDVEFILRRIGGSSERIDFVNHTELGNILQTRMENISIAAIPVFLRDIVGREEFYSGYVGRRERQNTGNEQLLPLRTAANRALYIRMAAYALIGMSRDRDVELLMKLVGHRYDLVAQAAAVRLVQLLGAAAIERLSREIGAAVSGLDARTFARSLRWAEIELWKQEGGAVPRA